MVEDIEKRREPLPLAAVYFISPTSTSVAQLVADFDSKPLYPSVHVFFSSGVTQEAVDKIKRCRVRGDRTFGCRELLRLKAAVGVAGMLCVLAVYCLNWMGSRHTSCSHCRPGFRRQQL